MGGQVDFTPTKLPLPEELRLVSFEYISPRKIMLPHQQSYVVSKVDDPSVSSAMRPKGLRKEK